MIHHKPEAVDAAISYCTSACAVALVLLVLIQVVIVMEVQEVMVHRQEYQDQQQLMLEVQLVVQEVIMDLQ